MFFSITFNCSFEHFLIHLVMQLKETTRYFV